MKDNKYTDSDVRKTLRIILEQPDTVDLYDVELLGKVGSLALEEFLKIDNSKENVVRYNEEVISDFFERYNIERTKFVDIEDLLQKLYELDSYASYKLEQAYDYNPGEAEYEYWKNIIKPPRKKKPKKPFENWLTHKIPNDRKVLFVEKLKAEFRNEKGLGIRYFIEAMLKLDYIIIPERQNKYFYNSLQDYFDWDIGSYSGIFNKKLEEHEDEEIRKAKERINSALI